MRTFPSLTSAEGPLRSPIGSDGADPSDRGELNEEMKRRRREEREREESAARERAKAKRQAKLIRRRLKAEKLKAAMATAEIFAIQQQLERHAMDLDPRAEVPEGASWVADDIALQAREAGRAALSQSIISLGEAQESAERDLKKSVKFVCTYDVEINREITAAIRIGQVREEYRERLNQIAWGGIIANNLGFLNSPVADRLSTAAELGLAPDITLKDIAVTIGTILYSPLIPLVAPAMMAWEVWCFNMALKKIEENARDERIRQESERFQREVAEAAERSRDHRWNRDPGWIDFIGRHGNIA